MGRETPSYKTKGNGPRKWLEDPIATKRKEMAPGRRWPRRPPANRLANAQLLVASVWCVVWRVLCGVWCGGVVLAAMCGDVVWCVVRCGVVWCGVVWGVVWCLVWCGVAWWELREVDLQC